MARKALTKSSESWKKLAKVSRSSIRTGWSTHSSHPSVEDSELAPAHPWNQLLSVSTARTFARAPDSSPAPSPSGGLAWSVPDRAEAVEDYVLVPAGEVLRLPESVHRLAHARHEALLEVDPRRVRVPCVHIPDTQSAPGTPGSVSAWRLDLVRVSGGSPAHDLVGDAVIRYLAHVQPHIAGQAQVVPATGMMVLMHQKAPHLRGACVAPSQAQIGGSYLQAILTSP
jgi:hypothetical protein